MAKSNLDGDGCGCSTLIGVLFIAWLMYKAYEGAGF